jgi:SAM-dependent methyltransferase
MIVKDVSAVARLRRSISRRGFTKTLGLISRELAVSVRRRWNYCRELRYDRRNRVETRGIAWQSGLHPPDAVHYQGTMPGVFRRIVASLPIDVRRYLFVDIGCGKGRTLLIALELGFRRVIGVELNEHLLAIARRNLASAHDRVDFVLQDAARYELPLEPTVVYLYNPFLHETMRAVLANIERSVRQVHDDLIVVYYNPVLRELLDEAPFLRSLYHEADVAVYRGLPLGVS